MSATPIEQRRARLCNQLSSALRRCASEHEAKSLLLVTPDDQETLTMIAAALRQGSASMDLEILEEDALEQPPEEHEPSSIRCVVGGAMLDGLGLAALSSQWRDECDGAILVVFHRRTRCDAIEECDRWLRDAGIPILGVVLSEERCPDFSDRWLLLKHGITQKLLFWRRPRTSKVEEVAR